MTEYRGPAALYSHEGHEPVNVNEEMKESLTLGQKAADVIAKVVGSWAFIILQTITFSVWMAVNVYAFYHPKIIYMWDGYPFILLNLMLSFESAYTGPIIMMSQNRQTKKDRFVAESDYAVNQKSEEELRVIMEHLVSQDDLLIHLMKEVKQEIGRKETKADDK
jgi:uncharacterized membrane protein